MGNTDHIKTSEQAKADLAQKAYFNRQGVDVTPGGELNSPLLYTYELTKPVETEYKNRPEVILVAGIRNPTNGEFALQIPALLESGVTAKVHYLHYSYDKGMETSEIINTLSQMIVDPNRRFVLMGASIGSDFIVEFIAHKLANGEAINNIDEALLISPVLSSMRGLPDMLGKAGRILKYGTRFAERFSKINPDQAHEIPPMALANVGNMEALARGLRVNTGDLPIFQEKVPTIEVHWVKEAKNSALDMSHEYTDIESQLEMLSKFRALAHHVIFSRDLDGLHGALADPKSAEQYTRIMVKSVRDLLEPQKD